MFHFGITALLHLNICHILKIHSCRFLWYISYVHTKLPAVELTCAFEVRSDNLRTGETPVLQTEMRRDAANISVFTRQIQTQT